MCDPVYLKVLKPRFRMMYNLMVLELMEYETTQFPKNYRGDETLIQECYM